MLISVGPAPEILKFLQVVSWIILPIMIGAIGFTLIAHFRKKRGNQKTKKLSEEDFLEASPEQVGYTKGDGEYVLFDHSALIQEYKSRLSTSHARVKALKHDLAQLESRYAATAMYLYKSDSKEAIESRMGMPKHVEAEIGHMARQLIVERREMEERVSLLESSYNKLEEENAHLLERIKLDTNTNEEQHQIFNTWNNENALLKEKLAETEYLKDLLDQKNEQIAFLNQQIEQGLKSQYAADHRRDLVIDELNSLKTDNAFILEQAAVLRNELQLKQDEIDRLNMEICAREEALANTTKQTARAKLPFAADISDFVIDRHHRHSIHYIS